MKKLLASLAVSLFALGGATAFADHEHDRHDRGYQGSHGSYGGGYGGGYGDERYERRGPPHDAGRPGIAFDRNALDRLAFRIEQGRRDGSLTRREARRLTWELNDLAMRRDSYFRTAGLSPWERRDLDYRFDALRTNIRIARTNSEFAHGYGPYRGPDAW